MTPSTTHLILIPAYNPGRLLETSVTEALSRWSPVWVVVDGSTDRSHEGMTASAQAGLEVMVLPENQGKGAAVLTGAERALARGFTHALVMDSDGQHPSSLIAEFMAASAADPGAVICGRPLFGPDAPLIRLAGRQLSIALVRLETRAKGAADPLFGFRVYPLRPLVDALGRTRGGRRYDFDPEVAVRLAWSGVRAVNLDAPCRYVPRGEGGVSHFHYLRDNLRMIAMHLRLLSDLALGKTRGPAA